MNKDIKTVNIKATDIRVAYFKCFNCDCEFDTVEQVEKTNSYGYIICPSCKSAENVNLYFKNKNIYPCITEILVD